MRRSRRARSQSGAASAGETERKFRADLGSARGRNEIKTALAKTLAVRQLSPEAKALADLYFFETVVRVHRAGEGEPYTGLKPAGRDPGPAIRAADQAVDSGKAEALAKLLSDAMHEQIRARFAEVIARKNYAPDDVQAGRAYIEAYVPFITYVERNKKR